MVKAAVLFSGGMDSASLLYRMRLNAEVMAVTINYGQRHKREIESARTITAKLGVEHVVFELPSWGALLPGSSQTDPSVPVPHGHYAAENMKTTVVPNRNMVLLALAGSVALTHGCCILAYGAHAGDHTIYPDCRPKFVSAMRWAFALCDWKALDLLTPYIEMTKGEICAEGVKNGVPLAETWTCYDGGAIHCGLCGSCTERKEAFAYAGVGDPTEYAA